MAGMGNPDGSLHATFGEGHLTKHVPSFGVVEPETLCPTNMRATTRPFYNNAVQRCSDLVSTKLDPGSLLRPFSTITLRTS